MMNDEILTPGVPTLSDEWVAQRTQHIVEEIATPTTRRNRRFGLTGVSGVTATTAVLVGLLGGWATPAFAGWSAQPTAPSTGQLSAAYLLECDLEAFHLFLRSYSDADVGGHHGPDAANQHVFLRHGVSHLLTRPLGIEHETVGLGRNVTVAVAIKPLKCLLANACIDAAAFHDQRRILQTGGGPGDRRGRHKILSASRNNFFQQLGARNHESATQARHSVNLRELAQHNHIFPSLDKIERGWRVAQVDVGFVDQNDRVFGLIGDEIFDVRVRSERAGGVVGITNIKDARVRAGGQHGLDVMSVGLRERNLDHARSRNGGHHHTRLETWVGGDVALLRRGEGQYAEAEGRSRTGRAVDVLGSEAFALGEGADEF